MSVTLPVWKRHLPDSPGQWVTVGGMVILALAFIPQFVRIVRDPATALGISPVYSGLKIAGMLLFVAGEVLGQKEGVPIYWPTLAATVFGGICYLVFLVMFFVASSRYSPSNIVCMCPPEQPPVILQLPKESHHRRRRSAQNIPPVGLSIFTRSANTAPERLGVVDRHI